MDEGRFQLYTGNGKGKTTAAIGLAIRALGAGLSVYIGQFIKGMRYSEISALETLAEALSSRAPSPRLELRQYGRGCFLRRSPEPEDIEAARGGLAEARAALTSGRFDLVILDEANVAVALGLIPEDELVALIKARPADVELVVTGRYAPPAITALADLVTEMCEVKHYYASGLEARVGIER